MIQPQGSTAASFPCLHAQLLSDIEAINSKQAKRPVSSLVTQQPEQPSPLRSNSLAADPFPWQHGAQQPRPSAVQRSSPSLPPCASPADRQRPRQLDAQAYCRVQSLAVLPLSVPCSPAQQQRADPLADTALQQQPGSPLLRGSTAAAPTTARRRRSPWQPLHCECTPLPPPISLIFMYV